MRSRQLETRLYPSKEAAIECNTYLAMPLKPGTIMYPSAHGYPSINHCNSCTSVGTTAVL